MHSRRESAVRGATHPPPLAARTRRSSSISLAWRLSTAASDSTSLTMALFTTRLARQAKRSVLWLSSPCTTAGVMLQMMAVLALPPSDGCRMRVSLLSLYGMWPPAQDAHSLVEGHLRLRQLHRTLHLSPAFLHDWLVYVRQHRYIATSQTYASNAAGT